MVSFAEFNSRGRHNWLVQDLRNATSALAELLRGRSRPMMISNVTTSGHFIGEAEATLHRVTECLRESGRVYLQGNTVVFLAGGNHHGRGCSPITIVIDGIITKTAPSVLSNIIMCRERKANPPGKGTRVDVPLEYDLQFAIPPSVLQQAFAVDGFVGELPEARYIVNHPVFDTDFRWLDVGYHQDQRILVCGDSFEPAPLGELVGYASPPRSIEEVRERLPPFLRRAVAGFHWNATVDLINLIGSALEIPLMPMLVEDGHPGTMLWGNKPGIGKSLAAQILAILKDGQQASPTSVEGGPREVENQIASELNDGRTVLFIDNQKGSLNIPILEANMTAKELAIRGFHIQKKMRRKNDVLWIITSNDSLPSDDMLSRCVHIRLHFEGLPERHSFAMTESELVAFVRDNRSAILAELAGMVTRWLDAGRPMAPAPSRFAVFGRVIGSVLAANGLPGFLSNTADEVREHSTKHQQLTAVAGRIIDGPAPGLIWEIHSPIEEADDEFKRRPPPASPMEQKDWIPYLMSEGVISAGCDTAQKRKTAATQFMSSVVKVPAEVDIGDQTVRAMIVSRPLRARRTAYALAVTRLPVGASPAPESTEPSTLVAPWEDAAAPLPADDTSYRPDDDGGGLWDA
jgi:hypothetical protein